jgi:hypothetical protein
MANGRDQKVTLETYIKLSLRGSSQPRSSQVNTIFLQRTRLRPSNFECPVILTIGSVYSYGSWSSLLPLPRASVGFGRPVSFRFRHIWTIC